MSVIRYSISMCENLFWESNESSNEKASIWNGGNDNMSLMPIISQYRKYVISSSLKYSSLFSVFNSMYNILNILMISLNIIQWKVTAVKIINIILFYNIY